jgi:hypothetical protein
MAIDPKLTDIGRRVLYIRPRKYGGPSEEGVITLITDDYIFVRYLPDTYAKATSREDLEWST